MANYEYLSDSSFKCVWESTKQKRNSSGVTCLYIKNLIKIRLLNDGSGRQRALEAFCSSLSIQQRAPAYRYVVEGTRLQVHGCRYMVTGVHGVRLPQPPENTKFCQIFRRVMTNNPSPCLHLHWRYWSTELSNSHESGLFASINFVNFLLIWMDEKPILFYRAKK